LLLLVLPLLKLFLLLKTLLSVIHLGFLGFDVGADRALVKTKAQERGEYLYVRMQKNKSLHN